MTTRPLLPVLRIPAAAAFVLALAVLTGCGDSTDDDGVASLAEETAVAATGASGESASGGTDDTEEELLAYVECLRDQGLDVPDPEVDAEGNLVLGGGGPGGDGAAGQGDAPSPEEFEAAQEVCGDVPAGAAGAVEAFDDPAFQDALLAFTQCLRDRGYEVADISADQGPQPGAGNPLGDLDLEDPAVAADVEECQTTAFAGVDVPAVGGQP